MTLEVVRWIQPKCVVHIRSAKDLHSGMKISCDDTSLGAPLPDSFGRRSRDVDTRTKLRRLKMQPAIHNPWNLSSAVGVCYRPILVGVFTHVGSFNAGILTKVCGATLLVNMRDIEPRKEDYGFDGAFLSP